jgi:hypothetical protein
MTTSETARHARAELETIAAGLGLRELAHLVAIGRRMAEACGAADEEAFARSAEGRLGVWVLR